ncbi:AAA family ATPase [Oscillatoria laete-virens NRMC-F 0139]|nr:AAA family ATPase [Oscillatoria laete-virens]MDL5052168.1 AAA family ATPase [Oscillatoria laete-virens NRMC-F 0139]
MPVISLINLKGGVAKTTTTVQLAECLVSEFGKKVLVVDLDPQTNATISLIDEEKWEELKDKNATLYHLFNDKLEGTSNFQLDLAIQKNVSNLKLRNLDLLASSIQFIDIQDRLTDIPAKTHHMINPMEVLKTSIGGIIGKYDYVLIDCPPNLGNITKNGIEISDAYLIPTIPDTLSTYGIPQIVKQIHEFSNYRQLKIRCMGLVITKYDSRSRAHMRGMQSLPARFGHIFDTLSLPHAPIFNSKMPQANSTSEAMEFGLEASSFKKKYGYGKQGDQPLHSYVTDLTREFIQNAG